jgi:protein involved in polysaccharide export with SLBB domain
MVYWGLIRSYRWSVWGGLRRAVFFSLALVGLCDAAFAQVSGISPEQLLQLQQQRSGSLSSASAPAVTPRETILEPTAPSAPLASSELEQILSERVGRRLQLYGYDQMGVGRAVSLPQVGAVQDDYVLGVGDEVVLSLRGQENSEYRGQVDRDGNVTFPRLNPISAAGRSFGKFRQDLTNAVHRAYVSTEGFVTVGRIRQISVQVSGEVGSPGMRTLTGLSSVSDAIFVSGGIRKSGSLRNVQIHRGGRTIVVDLYSVLVSGVQSKNVVLADGDRVVVPAVGGTVAVAGEVRRPAIYELPAGHKAISVREAVRLANGMATPGAYTTSLLRTMPNGTRQFVDVSSIGDLSLHDGEIILVKSAVNISLNQVKLTGAVRSPGVVALGKFKTLHDLLPSAEMMTPGAYMLLGFIDRTDPVTFQRSAIAFSPLHVVQGRENVPLKSDDIVHILTRYEVLQLLRLTSARDVRFAGAQDTQFAGGGEGRRTDEFGAGTGKQNTTGVGVNVTGMQDVTGAGQSYAAGTGMPDASSAKMHGTSGTGMPGTSGAANNTLGDANGMMMPMNPDGTRNPDGTSGRAVLPAAGSGITANILDRKNTRISDDVRTSATARSAAESAFAATATPGDVGGFSNIDGAFLSEALSSRWMSVMGAVRHPGTYLVASGTTLTEVLSVIGGFVDDADLQEFELTSTVFDKEKGTSVTSRNQYPGSAEALAQIEVKPFDRVEFRRVYSDKFSGSVKVEGEVRYPGVYNILRNENLSSVLRRAGGMTEVAYPEGAVFLRNSVAQAEEVESHRIANDMRSQLLMYVMKPTQGNSQAPTADGMKAMESLMLQIENKRALGRVPVTANLAALDKHPKLDTLLESGDSITIPKKPSTVLVVGEVLRAGAQRFDPSGSVDDYLENAGGTTEQADTSRIIVVLPDGSVRRESNSWLNFGFGSTIPPGSTIFVPRELDIYTMRLFVTDTIQIFSQLATSAAALAVLSKQ